MGPDLAKFRRLGAILKGFGNIFDGLFSAWKNFGTFLANFVCYRPKIHYFKLANLKQ